MIIKILNFSKETDAKTKQACKELKVKLSEFIRDAIGVYLYFMNLWKEGTVIYTLSDNGEYKEIQIPQFFIDEKLSDVESKILIILQDGEISTINLRNKLIESRGKNIYLGTLYAILRNLESEKKIISEYAGTNLNRDGNRERIYKLNRAI